MDKKTETKLLEKYAKTTGKEIKELVPILEKAKEDAKGKGQANSDNVIKAIFRKKVNGIIWAEKTGKTFNKKEPETFVGFILGANALRDIAESRRRKARNMYQAEGSSAILAGYVDESGNPLDWRPTIKNMRGEEVDNPNYHKPIIGNEYVREIYGIVKKKGEENKAPKVFTMSLWRDFASKFTLRPFVPVEFTSTVKTDGNFLVLNKPRAAKGEPAFKLTGAELDIEDWVRTGLKKYATKFDEMEQAVKVCQNAKDGWVMVEGLVDDIDLTVNPKTGSRSVTIVDPDSGSVDSMRVFIAKDFPIGFREYSRVIAFGGPRAWRRDPESDPMYSINGFSIYPIPGETFEENVEDGIDASAEDTEEGWDLFGN